jgi:hypothetical protein
MSKEEVALDVLPAVASAMLHCLACKQANLLDAATH